jgi:dolichyl-phosphate-mannose--protein O-mannosyl transferase
MQKLIKRFGYRRIWWSSTIVLALLTVMLALSIIMAVRTQQQLNSWVTFTTN